MSWGKDPNTGTWKRGDNPGGMELGPLHLRELGLAAAVVTILSIVLWLDARANDAPRWQPDRAAWPGWHVLGIVLVTLLCLLATVGVIWLFHTALVSMLRRSHEYRVQRERDTAETDRRRQQNGTTHLAELLAAAHIPAGGAIVRMTAAGWQIVNLGTEKGSILMGDDGTVRRTLHDDLAVAQIAARFEVEREDARARAFPALHTLQQRSEGGKVLTDDATANQQPAAWPRLVRLHEIAPEPVTVHRLALGITVDESGNAVPVTAALGEMVHVAVGGSSGWGKSIFLKALALQLATALEPVALAMVDLEGVTFAAFSRADRLLWPIAETTGQALRIMTNLLEEMERRRALFHEFPGVDSLSAYNARVDEPLAPLVVLVDEATALLADKGVHNRTKELVLRARKFGIWFVLGGQDWKASSLDTALRNMLATRVQFHASSGSQSRVLLGDGAAAGLTVAGRAIAQLPGRPQLEIQAPLVTAAEIAAALRGQEGPAGELPEEEEEVEGDPEAERILELHRKGWTSRAIEREIFGKTGGAYYERVRRVLESAATTTRDNGDGCSWGSAE